MGADCVNPVCCGVALQIDYRTQGEYIDILHICQVCICQDALHAWRHAVSVNGSCDHTSGSCSVYAELGCK